MTDPSSSSHAGGWAARVGWAVAAAALLMALLLAADWGFGRGLKRTLFLVRSRPRLPLFAVGTEHGTVGMGGCVASRSLPTRIWPLKLRVTCDRVSPDAEVATAPTSRVLVNRLGFLVFWDSVYNDRARAWSFDVPDWFAIPLLLLISFCCSPVRAIWRSRRRAARGQCLACGYDLRSTPGRCPECGRPAEAR